MLLNMPAIGEGAQGTTRSRPEPLADDLQRLWREVFDQSRVVAREQAGAGEREEGHAEPARRDGDDAAMPHALRRGGAACQDIGAAQAGPPRGVTPASSANHPLPTRGDPDAPLDRLAAVTERGVGAEAIPRAMPAGRRNPLSPPAARAPDLLPAGPVVAPVLADEVVQVYREGGTLAIVIRDLQLGDEEAIACALETSRRLLGDAGGLRQVVLNGRQIYRAGEAAAATDGDRSRSPVSFIC